MSISGTLLVSEAVVHPNDSVETSTLRFIPKGFALGDLLPAFRVARTAKDSWRFLISIPRLVQIGGSGRTERVAPVERDANARDMLP